MKLKFIVAALLITAVSIGQAADWPNWRGPDHNGISMETDWFEKWGSSGPKRLWNASVVELLIETERLEVAEKKRARRWQGEG